LLLLLLLPPLSPPSTNLIFRKIITWNDYGESHYIGPIQTPGIPSGAERFVSNMPHDHWRDLLPYYIDAYKSGNTNTILPRSLLTSNSTSNTTLITNTTMTSNNTMGDTLTMHYRPSALSAGSTGGTTLNDPAYQPALAPSLALSDAIFITGFLSAPAQLVVTISGNPPTTVEVLTAGLGRWEVPFHGQTGENVTVAVVRNSRFGTLVAGRGIDATADEGVNFNAWVGGSGAG
jgi:hypothetical protein